MALGQASAFNVHCRDVAEPAANQDCCIGG
jgi:hypothetical protein